MDQLEEWIAYIFDHPVAGAIREAWYWSEDAPEWRGTPEDIPALIAETFGHAGELLARFSDEQLDQGFWFLVGNTPPGFTVTLVDAQIPLPARFSALRSFVPLFEQVMAIRCSPHLSHLAEQAAANPPNSACYMWWDLLRFPLLELNGPAEAERDLFHSEILVILRRLLAIPHDACRESALHGLGHWALHYPQAAEIVDEFLSNTPGLRRELIAYTERAKIGNVL
jgi:hypothetical protein